MGRVDRARRPQQRGEAQDLAGRGGHGRLVREAGRHADRPRVERFGEAVTHDRDLVVGRGPVDAVHRTEPQRRVAAQHRGIRGGGRRVQPVEEIVHARELEARADEVERRQRPLAGQCVGRKADTAIADDDRGHALAGLVEHVRPVEERVVVVGMDVDEARADHAAGGIHFHRARGPRQIAERGDPVALDADIGLGPGRAGSVDHVAVADQKIEAVGIHGRRPFVAK